MPLCVHCAYPAKWLYTTYKTKSNIRLGVCVSCLSPERTEQALIAQARCDRFLDPLLEHESLTLLLDLILLKPRVFLHLLFNRGSPPYDATQSKVVERAGDREGRIRRDVGVLMVTVILVETVARTLPQRDELSLTLVIISLSTVVAETLCQHAITLGFTLLVLRWRGWYPRIGLQKADSMDGRQLDFMYVAAT